MLSKLNKTSPFVLIFDCLVFSCSLKTPFFFFFVENWLENRNQSVRKGSYSSEAVLQKKNLRLTGLGGTCPEPPGF